MIINKLQCICSEGSTTGGAAQSTEQGGGASTIPVGEGVAASEEDDFADFQEAPAPPTNSGTHFL